MDKLCERLINTYNATLLDDVGVMPQAVFFDESKKHMDGTKGLTTLMKLIYNHYRAEKPMPAFIGGPKTLTLHWSDKYQMMVYTFGEWHSSNVDCRKFKDYNKRLGKGGKCPKEQVWVKKYKRCEQLHRDGCNANQVRNPNSGRCVSKKGPTGRKLLEEAKEDRRKKGGGEMNIEEFLEKLVLSTDAFLDIYFEFPAYVGEEYDDADLLARGDRMERLLRRFETCVQYAQRGADKCKLARVHYFDIRKAENEGVHDVAWFRRKMQRTLRKPNKAKALRTLWNNDPRIRRVVEGLGEKDNKKFDKFWKDQITQNPYVQKELNRTSLKDEILNFVTKDMLEEARGEHVRWMSEAPKVLNGTDKEFAAALEKMYHATVFPNARIADIYTLARIFKTFDVDRDAYRHGNLDQPVKPHNVIIYAGDAHSRMDREFLEHIGFKELARTGSSNAWMGNARHCLDMEKFPQPFFSHIPENRGFFAKLFGW